MVQAYRPPKKKTIARDGRQPVQQREYMGGGVNRPPTTGVQGRPGAGGMPFDPSVKGAREEYRAKNPQQGGTTTPYSQFEDAQRKANEANEARYQEGLGKFGQVEDMYKPGGSWGAGMSAQIESQKGRDVASGMQNLVSSGMGNTTVAASLPQAWEQNVGSQARLNLADLQGERYASALGNTAGFIERRTDAAPDMGQYADLVAQSSMGQPQYQPQQPQAQKYGNYNSNPAGPQQLSVGKQMQQQKYGTYAGDPNPPQKPQIQPVQRYAKEGADRHNGLPVNFRKRRY